MAEDKLLMAPKMNYFQLGNSSKMNIFSVNRLKKLYNKSMYNWNIDTKELKKNTQKYTVWRLEQLINYGLNGEKIQANVLKKYWNILHLDPKRKRVLYSWLWQKQSLPKHNKHS